MKKIFRTLAIVAVAALGLTACENDINEQINGNEGEKVTVEVVGTVADLTRSTFGEINTTDGKVPSTWSGNETVGFSAAEATPVTATNTTAGLTASFSVEFDAIEEGNTVYAVSPYTSNRTEGGFTGINTEYQDFYVTIPAEQTPLAGSVQESAHLMFAEGTYEGGAMTMTFNHVAAYGKMNITNFAGNGIASVAITFPENVVGQAYYYYAGEKVGTWDSFDSATITLNPENVENNEFWFALAPVGALSGTLNVVVTDNDDKTYTKSIDLPKEGRTITFAKGQVSAFTVNMTGVEADKVEPCEVVPVGVGLDANNQQETLSWTYGENDNFTTTIVKGTASTNPREDTDGQLRMYKGNELTFTAESGSIVKIEMTVTEGSNTLTASVGNMAYDTESKVITWTGLVNEVTFTTSAKIFFNPIKVYYSDEEPIVAQPLATPEIIAEVQNLTEAYVIWDDVENAVSYTVTCGEQTQTVAAGVGEATFTGLVYSTDYTISVVAHPEVGSLYWLDSEAATTTVTTGADATDYSGKYLIVAQNGGKYYYMSTWKDGQTLITDGNNRTAVDSGVTEITDYNSSADFDNTVDEKYVWNVEAVEGGYTFANSDKSAWLYLGSNENRAKMTTTENEKETFTISKEGNVYTIKATSYTRTLALNSNLFACYASGSYVYDIVLIPFTGTILPTSSLAFDVESVTVDLADFSGEFTEPTPTLTTDQAYTTGFTLSYSSSNADVATVDGDGNVTIKGVIGTAVITATFAGDENFKGCSASYTINVVDNTPIEGAGEPYSYEFTSKQFSANGSETLNGLSWTLAGDGGYWAYDNTKGQHLGSGSKPYKSLTLSTNDYNGAVKKIVINTCGGSSVNATLTVTVGDTVIGEATKISATATEYTFESATPLTGEIKLSYTQTSSKAIYIKSIAINNN